MATDTSRLILVEPPSDNPSRAEFVYLLLAGVFIGALVITNVIAGKFFELFGRPLSCGIIAYPVTFLVTDLISEIYGERRATQVVKVGFVVSVFITLVVVISNLAPAAATTYVDQTSFGKVFGLTPGIVFGSMCAYLVAQLVDVRVFEFWRRLTEGRHLWLRNNGSTMLSQLLDTAIVVTTTLVVWPMFDADATTEPISSGLWWELVVGQYLFKAVVALLDTPLFYLGSAFLSRFVSGDAGAPGLLVPTRADDPLGR